MPIVVLAYMNVFTFVIPTESGEKTGFSITIFLSFVVLLIINNDSMPENSDTISIYASFVLAMTILSTVSLIVCVLQVRALTFSERKYPISKRVKKAVKHLKWIQSIVSCRGKNNKVDRTDSEEEGIEFENKLENEKLFVVYDDMLDGDANTNTRKEKKVSFMDADEEDGVYNARFVMTRHREASTLSTEYGRENTLFESDTLMRSATLFSMNDPLIIDEKCNEHGRPYSKKSVRFAETKENYWRSDLKDNQPLLSETVKATTMVEGISESQNEQPSSRFRRTKEMKGESNKDINALPITALVVSPMPVSKDKSFTLNEGFDKVMDHKIETIEHRPMSSRSQRTQVTGITGFDPVICELSLIDTVSNQCIEPSSRPLSSSNRSHLNADKIIKANGPTVSSGVESNLNIGKAGQSGTITDNIEVKQPSVAEEYKMNRQPSDPEIKPFPFSRELSSTGSRLIQVENIGTEHTANIRPFSQCSGRALSVQSHRPGTCISQRPFSVLNRANLNTFVQSIETDVAADTTDNDLKSETSKESIDRESEASDAGISGDDDISWPEIVSCIDLLLFTLTLLLTTLMAMAMFLTMITA